MKNKIIWFIIFVILVIAIILASRFVNKQGEETIQESKENTNILNEGEENMNIIKVSDENFVQEVNVDESQNTAIKYQVMSIPTLVVIKNGNEVNRSVGLIDKQEVLNLVK